jgi:transcriptional antiterminator NusG
MDNKIILKNISKNLQWYVINTYSGSENHVKKNLVKRIKKNSLENYFGEILIPVETIENIKNGTRTIKTRKCYPGYILIELFLNEKTWLLIKYTPKVIGFVGNSKKPLSLNEKDVKNLYNTINKSKIPKKKLLYKLGTYVRINNGPFMNLGGTIETVNLEREKIKIRINIFGRLTPVELDFSHIDKIN